VWWGGGKGRASGNLLEITGRGVTAAQKHKRQKKGIVVGERRKLNHAVT